MFWMMSSGKIHLGWDLHPSRSQGSILEQYWLHLNFPFTENNYIQRGKGGHRPGRAERGVGMSIRMEYELLRAQVDPWNTPLLSSVLRNTCSHPKGAPTWDHWMIKERGPPIAQDTWVQMLPRCAANLNTETPRFAAKRGLIRKASSEKMGEPISDPPPWSQGAQVFMG